MTTYTNIGFPDRTMKHIKIADLKAHLSENLACVRRGETIIVCDRNTPIARIVPIDDELDDFEITEAEGSPADILLGRPIPLIGDADPVAILLELRGDR